MNKINLKKILKPERIAVFIDAANLWSSYKSMGNMLDLKKISSFFSNKFNGKVYKIFYYVAYPDDGTRDKTTIDKLHKFFTYLKKGLGFEIVKKPLKIIKLRDSEGEIICDSVGNPKCIEKGNLDVEIAIDVIKYSTAYDLAVFITGDSDFLPLISFLRNLNKPKKVYIFSTADCISTELKTGADGYFDLASFPEIHGDKLLNKKDRKK